MTQTTILEHLFALRSDMSEIKLDLRETKHRMTALEAAMANLAIQEASHYASLASRFDHLDDRMGRIERRLEIA
jgi:predicted  nucleic acid-binding Zn-ribbon protein